MTEHPILFSSEMVRAILDGKKTQTRRVLRQQPLDILPMKVPNLWVTLETRDPNHGRLIRCRYGIPGDILWVRETWCEMCKVADPYCECDEEDQKLYHYYEYRADTNNKYPGDWDAAEKEEQDADYVPRWQPSIHMPRKASRISLEVVSVRVERVQAITQVDALAEGLVGSIEAGTPVGQFMKLWDSINAKRGFCWDANPWVWVIEFRRVNQ